MIESMQIPVQMYTDALTQPLIAPVQETLTAKQAYGAGDFFIYRSKLYEVISTIAQGAAIVLEGSGANATDGGTAMSENNILPQPTDANEYASKEGLWYFFVKNTALNLPSSSHGDGIILQIRVRGDALAQIFFDGWANPTKIWTRMQWGTTWYDWSEVTNTTTDVTSLAFGTLPSGLSIKYADLHKISKNGKVATLTFSCDRSSGYASGTGFDYIKVGYRPKNRVYVMGFGYIGAAYYPIVAYITTDGKLSITFKEDVNSVYFTATYIIA